VRTVRVEAYVLGKQPNTDSSTWLELTVEAPSESIPLHKQEEVVIYPTHEDPVTEYLRELREELEACGKLGTHKAFDCETHIRADDDGWTVYGLTELAPGPDPLAAARALRAKLEPEQKKPVEVMTDAMKLAELHRAGCRIEDMTWLSNEQVSLRIRQGHRGWVDDYKARSVSEALSLAVRDIREEEA